MRKMTRKMPSMSLISWAQEKMGRDLQILDVVLQRGTPMSWVSQRLTDRPG